MALKVRWTPIALLDLDQAFEYISADKPEAARSVIKKVLAGIDQLQKFPESGREGRVKGIHELVVSTTPYIIIYKVNVKTLVILSVLHSSRKWPLA